MQPSQQKCRVSIHMKAVSPLKPLLKIGFREIFYPMGGDTLQANAIVGRDTI